MAKRRQNPPTKPPEIPVIWLNRITRYGAEDPKLLLANKKNWRTHPLIQREALESALNKVGVVQNVIVNERSGRMIDGHLRVEMAISTGQPTVPITYVDLSDDEENLILATIDPVTGLAGTDQALLDSLISDIRLSDISLDFGNGLNELLESLSPSSYAAAAGEDDVPALSESPVSKAGDVWLLGRHRVLCGDATCPEDVARLLDGMRADMVFTDPPYNVDYEGYTDRKLKIEGDARTTEQFSAFLGEVFRSYHAAVKPEASLYVCHGSSFQREFQTAIENAGFEVRTQLIWGKNTFGWGFARYKFQHEPIFYCHVTGQKDAWYGDKTQATLWQVNKPAANRLHPTMKPIELIEIALGNSSVAGNVVVDLFGGSGSTLIASEKTDRVALLMELDPRYTDVIVERWQQFKGSAAKLAGDGRTFEDIRAERYA